MTGRAIPTRVRRCYYCEREGTRGFILVDGLPACANLDACNKRTHRIFEKARRNRDGRD